eukprot:Gb_31511 [translate_table: standard]
MAMKRGVAWALVLALVLVSSQMARFGSAICSDENDALDHVVPCVTEGTVETHPESRCCEGMKKISLDCFCDILISASGGLNAHIVNDYIHACNMTVPPGFQCTV